MPNLKIRDVVHGTSYSSELSKILQNSSDKKIPFKVKGLPYGDKNLTNAQMTTNIYNPSKSLYEVNPMRSYMNNNSVIGHEFGHIMTNIGGNNLGVNPHTIGLFDMTQQRQPF